jgi:hypothetical protein
VKASKYFIRTAVVCAALAALPATSVAQRGLTIPDSLTDREFWALFATMSEEGGIDSTSMFIRALPASPNPTINVGPQVFGTLASNLSNFRMQVTDSSGVRILMATGIDSSGKAITTRIVAPSQPNTLATTSAFISGITPINRVLEAFANGQLKTYERLTAMTKTEDWKSPP